METSIGFSLSYPSINLLLVSLNMTFLSDQEAYRNTLFRTDIVQTLRRDGSVRETAWVLLVNALSV